MEESDIELAQDGRILRIYIQYIIKETGEINTYNMELAADDNPYNT